LHEYFLRNMILFSFLYLLTGADWNYDNQTQWPGSCSNDFQSPINLTLPSTFPNRTDLQLSYASQSTMVLFKTNHSVGLNVSKSGSVTFNGTQSSLQEIHFHRHSEHMVKSTGYYDYEVHLVHSTEDGNILVVAALCTTQDSDDPSWFTTLVSPLNELFTLDADHLEIPIEVDMGAFKADVLKGFHNYWSYSGSSSTPPCSPAIWFVHAIGSCAIPQVMSTVLQKFTQLDKNYRYTQPLQGRTVHISDAVMPTTTSTSTTTTTAPRNTTTPPSNHTSSTSTTAEPEPKKEEHNDSVSIAVTVILVILLITAGTWWYCYAQKAVRVQKSSAAERHLSIQGKRSAPLLNGHYLLSEDQMQEQFDGIEPVRDNMDEDEIDVFRVYPPGDIDHYY